MVSVGAAVGGERGVLKGFAVSVWESMSVAEKNGSVETTGCRTVLLLLDRLD